VTLTIVSREVNGIAILDLSGRITLGEGSVQLREAIRELIAKNSNNILLNLEAVDLIDSSGVGELALALKATQNRGGELKLLNPTGKVLDLLQLTKLSTVIEIKNDEAAAIASF
jgi:anti-sigma B factor antagonist